MLEIIGIICGISLIILFWIIMIDTHRFVVTNYKIKSDKINRKTRIVLITDLHSKQYGKNNKQLMSEIRNQHPDYICIAGDMIVGTTKETGDISIALLEQLSKVCPVFYANGNHEQRWKNKPEVYGERYQKYKNSVQKFATYLENKKVYLKEENIVITGFELPRKYYNRFDKVPLESDLLVEKLGESDGLAFQILLAHNPLYFEDYANWGADLSLAGHVHGGLVRLPFLGGLVAPSITFFPKYDSGFFEKKQRKMILSRGLGTHTLHIRVFNPGEIVIIDLEKEGQLFA